MKKYLILFFAIGAFLIGALNYQKINSTNLNNLLTYSVCDNPITYKVGKIDPQFSLSWDEFIDDIEKAAQIWNKTINKEIFKYNPEGDLTISLIFDGRQSLITKVNQLESNVKNDQKALEPEINEYEKLSADFEARVETLNKEIDSWNEKGGAPSEEYQKILERQKQLKEEAEKLNEMAKRLNSTTHLYNSQVDKLNESISNLNDALERRPEEGIFKYPENIIEIYFATTQQELIHTLAHELGHSIGLEHINNPKSIMYFRTNQFIAPTTEDIRALENICQKRNRLELIQYYINLILIRFKANG